MGISWKFGFFGFWDIFAKRPEVVPSLSQPWVGFPRYQAWQQSPSPRVPLRSVALGCRSHPRPARCAHAPPSGTERIGSATQKRKSRWFQKSQPQSRFWKPPNPKKPSKKNLHDLSFPKWFGFPSFPLVSPWFFFSWCFVMSFFTHLLIAFRSTRKFHGFHHLRFYQRQGSTFGPWTTGQGYTCYMKL